MCTVISLESTQEIPNKDKTTFLTSLAMVQLRRRWLTETAAHRTCTVFHGQNAVLNRYPCKNDHFHRSPHWPHVSQNMAGSIPSEKAGIKWLNIQINRGSPRPHYDIHSKMRHRGLLQEFFLLLLLYFFGKQNWCKSWRIWMALLALL